MGDNVGLFFGNALAFLRQAGQWNADPVAGTLHYKPAPSKDMTRANAVLPRL